MDVRATTDNDLVIIGRTAGAFGTQGWLKIISYTRPRDNICDYRPWFLLVDDIWRKFPVIACKPRGTGLIAQLQGINDRDSALDQKNSQIAIEKTVLPLCEVDEYYWSELIGLEVETVRGKTLGRVSEIIQTGANDVMVVQGEVEHLIPYVSEHFILNVDIAAGQMLVDWHEDE